MGNEEKYASTAKYVVEARFTVEGVVEKPDVIGAIFGQTEGLFGPDLDLRELQKRQDRPNRNTARVEARQDFRNYHYSFEP